MTEEGLREIRSTEIQIAVDHCCSDSRYPAINPFSSRFLSTLNRRAILPVQTKERHQLIVGFIAFLSMLSGAVLLGLEVFEGETLKFDTAVISALRVVGNPTDPIGPDWLEEAARDMTALGSFTILFAIVAFVSCYLFLGGKRRNAYFLVVSSCSGALLSTVLKMVLERPRPELTGVTRVFTSSFPSGHALSSAIVYFTIGVFVARSAANRSLQYLVLCAAAILTCLVGVSRVYLGVHYPSDVLAGWLIGLGWALLCWLVSESMSTYSRKLD